MDTETTQSPLQVIKFGLCATLVKILKSVLELLGIRNLTNLENVSVQIENMILKCLHFFLVSSAKLKNTLDRDLSKV